MSIVLLVQQVLDLVPRLHSLLFGPSCQGTFGGESFHTDLENGQNAVFDYIGCRKSVLESYGWESVRILPCTAYVLYISTSRPTSLQAMHIIACMLFQTLRYLRQHSAQPTLRQYWLQPPAFPPSWWSLTGKRGMRDSMHFWLPRTRIR